MKKILLSLLLIVGLVSAFNTQARFGNFVGGVAGGALGTAGAIASAPFHAGYGYYGPSYGYSYPSYGYSYYPSYSYEYDYPNYYYL